MNTKKVTELKKLQKERSDAEYFSKNLEEFLLWSDSVYPLLEFDEDLRKEFKHWVVVVKGPHRVPDDNRGVISDVIGIVNKTITKMELQREPTPLDNEKESKKELEYPDKVTLKWLFSYVPWSFWAWAVGLLLFTFSLGLTAAETKLYTDLKTKIVNQVTKSKITVKPIQKKN